MADDPTDTTDTDESAPSNAELAQRIEDQGSKIDMILDKLTGAKTEAHAAAQQHTEDRLDRPSSIADEIRQQLAEQRAKEQAAARDQDSENWRKSVDERLTGMAEKTPEAPLRRVEKFMGWRG